MYGLCELFDRVGRCGTIGLMRNLSRVEKTAALALPLLALGLSACSSDTATESPSPSASDTSSVMIAAVALNDAAGAVTVSTNAALAAKQNANETFSNTVAKLAKDPKMATLVGNTNSTSAPTRFALSYSGQCSTWVVKGTQLSAPTNSAGSAVAGACVAGDVKKPAKPTA